MDTPQVALEREKLDKTQKRTSRHHLQIIFRPLVQLLGIMKDLKRELSATEIARFSWRVNIVEKGKVSLEEGKRFHQFEGKSHPPEEIVWDGRNAKGQKIRSDRIYSPIYMFPGAPGETLFRVGYSFMGSGKLVKPANAVPVGDE